jgi:selenide,water dikinase
MRLTHLVTTGGCASKLSQLQLSEVLKKIPKSNNPDLLVGFDSRDDAGVFRITDDMALVQTVDFFTPIVDDPYAYGSIAAANALSDVYAMGGRPLTVLNLCCFSPAAAPPEVWSAILMGAYDKTLEAGATVVGGHSIDDERPKFGCSVTGLVNPKRMFANTEAEPGDDIYLTKPLGTGIITTAAKNDACRVETLEAAIMSMTTLNAEACAQGLEAGVRCATDITGFGLTGHLYNVARASGVSIEIETCALPLLPEVEGLIGQAFTTGGGARNRAFIGDDLLIGSEVPDWLQHLIVDPQTSGGLALFSRVPISGAAKIGRVTAGPPALRAV